MTGVEGHVLEVGQDHDRENGSDPIPVIMVMMAVDQGMCRVDISLEDGIPDLDQEVTHPILQDRDHRLGPIHLPVLIHFPIHVLVQGLVQNQDLLHLTIKPGKRF